MRTRYMPPPWRTLESQTLDAFGLAGQVHVLVQALSPDRNRGRRYVSYAWRDISMNAPFA